VIMGQDFLRRNKVALMSFIEKMVIMGAKKPYVVHTTNKKLVGKTQLIIALSFKKVARRKISHIFIITLLGEEGDKEMGTLVPLELSNLFEKYVDRMSEDMPNEIPPRSHVDHRIELESGAKSVAKSPY